MPEPAVVRTYSQIDREIARQQQPKSARAKFKVEDHFMIVQTISGPRHVCKEQGCSRSFKTTTSSSHKRDHTYSHHYTKPVNFQSMLKPFKLATIVKFLASSGSPFVLVEDPQFRFITGGTKFSRKTASMKSREMSQKLKRDLVTKLRSVKYVSLTMDIWTSIAVKPYLCCTVHYVDSESKMRSELLHFNSIDPPHTGSNIREKIEAIIDFYEIESSIVAITADGAANEDCAIRQLNSIRSARNAYAIRRVFCVAHLINNVVRYGLEELNSAIEKVRAITFDIKNSARLTHLLKRVQKVAGSKPLGVIKDVVTRWNSTFMMIERYVKLEPFLNDLIATDVKLVEYQLLEHEVTQLRSSLELLRPFKVATDFFSCSKSQNLGAVVNVYRELVSKMRGARDLEGESSTLPTRLLHALETRKEKFESKDNMIAAALDPMWKFSPFIAQHELQEVLMEALSLTREENTTSECSQGRAADSELFSIFSRPSVSTYDDDDLQSYLNDKAGTQIEYHDWWKLNQSKYPRLYELAMQFATIRATSVASEAKFSFAGNMIGTRRSQLDDCSVEAIMTINSSDKVLQPEPLDESDESDIIDTVILSSQESVG